MVFGFIPECRSASFRNQRSASPESSFSDYEEKSSAAEANWRARFLFYIPDKMRSRYLNPIASKFTV
jgi:hypothetical protein